MIILKEIKATYEGLFNYKRNDVIIAYKKKLYVYNQDLKKETLYKVNYFLNIQGYNTFLYDSEEDVLKALNDTIKTRLQLFKKYKIKSIDNIKVSW